MPRGKLAAVVKPAPLSADVFIHMTRKALKHLLKDYALCQRSPSMLNVHRLRKTIRQVRALLDVFRQWSANRTGRELHERIRQLQHALGPLRDMHVRILALESLVKKHPGLVSLLRRARKEEREERIAVRELLAKWELGEAGSLRHRLRAYKSVGSPRAALTKSLALGSRELSTRWKAVRAKDPRSMHRVRIALRRHTQLLGTMAPYLGADLVKDLPAMRRMQNRLGRAHDAWTLADWTATVLMKLPVADRTAVVAYLDRSLHLLDRRVEALAREYR